MQLRLTCKPPLKFCPHEQVFSTPKSCHQSTTNNTIAKNGFRKRKLNVNPNVEMQKLSDNRYNQILKS
ncbi:hypothetical protein Mapa_013305 [Marchantia paleacea]|nr:hypothetical protein Mapa_013305 [Marchantia paleacea]